VNFFSRRRILKKANFLDLVPVRLVGQEEREEGGITLLMPRFRNSHTARLLQLRSKGRFIRIRLDRFGSEVWKMVDGKTSVAGVISGLCRQFPGVISPGDDTNKRVTDFLSKLYQERYITFREIMDETKVIGK